MKKIEKVSRPVRVIQFGEGNFLRAFADEMLDIANEKGVFDGNVVIVKPRKGAPSPAFAEQDCVYTVVRRGRENGKVVNDSRIITCVDRVISCYDEPEEFLALARIETLRFVVSNTTEAGIVLDEGDAFDGVPETYPGKLTKFLYERWTAFGGAADKGLIVLPAELIENNGGELLRCVLALAAIWMLPEAFAAWVKENCIFCNTLVDRIVTGYPKENADALFDELGYHDALADLCEPFALWVIESKTDIRDELPLDKAGLPVVFTDDLTPYRERKVRILNGAHTSGVLAGYLYGIDIVRDCMQDDIMGKFFRRAVGEEIVPFVKLPREDVEAFAASVFERFDNPFIDHALLSISLNSVSKWKARVLPSFKDYVKTNGSLPRLLTFSFAALLAFYSSAEYSDGVLHAKRANGDEYTVKDSPAVLAFFAENAGKAIPGFVSLAAARTDFWGEDLSVYPGFVETVSENLAAIRMDIGKAVKDILGA